MPVESELGRGCDWATTAGSILGVPIGPVVAPPRTCHPRLEFAAFSVKSMVMTARGNGFGEHGQAGWSFPALALAVALVWLLPASPSAQMFQDRPPPVPPASVPDAPSGPALNLAPPSGAGAIPTFPGPLNQRTIVQPSLATVPPVVPPPGAPIASQAVLSLTARYGKDLPVINGGVVWRGGVAQSATSDLRA